MDGDGGQLNEQMTVWTVTFTRKAGGKETAAPKQNESFTSREHAWFQGVTKLYADIKTSVLSHAN